MTRAVLRIGWRIALVLTLGGCHVEVPPGAVPCVRDRCEGPYQNCEVNCAVLTGEPFASCHDGCSHQKYECALTCPGVSRRLGTSARDSVSYTYLPGATPVPRFPEALPAGALRP